MTEKELLRRAGKMPLLAATMILEARPVGCPGCGCTDESSRRCEIHGPAALVACAYEYGVKPGEVLRVERLCDEGLGEEIQSQIAGGRLALLLDEQTVRRARVQMKVAG